MFTCSTAAKCEYCKPDHNTSTTQKYFVRPKLHQKFASVTVCACTVNCSQNDLCSIIRPQVSLIPQPWKSSSFYNNMYVYIAYCLVPLVNLLFSTRADNEAQSMLGSVQGHTLFYLPSDPPTEKWP